MTWVAHGDGDGGAPRRFPVAVTPTGVWVGYPGGASFVPNPQPAAAAGAAAGAGRTATGPAPGTDAVCAPMAGRLVQLAAAVGQACAEGDVLAVVESMKMEVPLIAPRAGVIATVAARRGALVGLDAVVVTLAPP